MDGDVSRKEKEVHCTCIDAICEIADGTHPLNCPKCKDGKCPVAIPCTNHEIGGFATHLCGLISKWLCMSEKSAPVIITIPCDSIDTWVAVAYGDLHDHCESYPDPWDSLIARGKYYHSIRIQGKKKRVLYFKQFADRICSNWNTVKEFCPQARAFESAIHGKLLS